MSVYKLALPKTALASKTVNVFLRTQAPDGQFQGWSKKHSLHGNTTEVPIVFNVVGLSQVKVNYSGVFNRLLGNFRVQQSTFHVTTGKSFSTDTMSQGQPGAHHASITAVEFG